MSDPKEQKFGDLLVEAGVLKPDVLAALLEEGLSQAENRIASRILARGLLSEADLVAVLAHQHGHPGVVLETSVIETTGPKLIPRAVAERHHLLPLEVTKDTIVLACTDIFDRAVFDQIRFSCGREVHLVVALEGRIRAMMPLLYEAYQDGKSVVTLNAEQSDSSKEPHLDILRPKNIIQDEEALQESTLTTIDTEIKAPSTQGSGQQRGSKPLVLVVEDDSAIRRLLVQVLTHQNCNVLEAASGRDALHKLRQDLPDLVVLDAMLPEIHGFEICSRMKESSVYSSIPVIMVSAIYKGWEHARDIQEVHKADAFIEKPFEIGYLRATVAGFLGQHAPEKTGLLHPHEAVDACRKQALAFYENDDIPSATAELERWIELDPFDSGPYLLQGNIAFQQGAFDQALRCYERATTFDPDSFSSWKNLALVHENLGFSQKSVGSWKKAMLLAPNGITRQQILNRLQTIDESVTSMWGI